MTNYNFLCVVILCLAVQIQAVDDCKEKTKQLLDEYYYSTFLRPHLPRQFRPWRIYSPWTGSDKGVKSNEERFYYSMNVVDFEPSDITVKIIGWTVVVEAKHEERKEEDGFVSRQIIKRYQIPDQVQPDEIISELSADGILSISAPKAKTYSAAKGRVISITLTGPKKNEDKEAKEEEKGESCEKDIFVE